MPKKNCLSGEMEKLAVIDGNSLLNRAFYALPLLQTKDGYYTNAIYGFVSMLIRLIEDYSPKYVAVVFDSKEKTFRHKKYPRYKAHRDKAPDEMLPQLPLLKELLSALNIYYIEKPGYEADDLIGTLVKKADHHNLMSYIVTGDKDMLQLIDDDIFVLLTKKGITNIETYDKEKVEKDFGIKVDQLIDIKALTGDKSDNVPGIPGVGEKTAYKLIQNHDNIENLYENLDQISGKMKHKIYENRSQAFLSKELVTIDTAAELPVEFNWDLLSKFNLRNKAGKEILQKLEMHSILERLPSLDGHSNGDIHASEANRIMDSENKSQKTFIYFSGEQDEIGRLNDELKQLARDQKVVLYRHRPFSGGSKKQKEIYPEPDGGVVVSLKNKTYFVPEKAIDQTLNQALIPNFPLQIITHDLKGLWHLFYRTSGLDLMHHLKNNNTVRETQKEANKKGNYEGNNGGDIHDVSFFDVSIMSYIIDPAGSPFYLEDLVQEHQLNVTLHPLSMGWEAICERGEGLYALMDPIIELLINRKQWDLYREIELPLSLMLARMEHRGIYVDTKILNQREAVIDQKIEQIQQKVYEMAGEVFNLNSPKQLGHILFEKMGLPVIKKTKTGYSTDAQTLETLAKDYEICQHLLDYRQFHKIKTTYLEGLKDLVNPNTSKIHTTFNQTITATGRLSSTDPNLQNIPIKLEEGRKIRKAFRVEKEHNTFLAADYSQIDLRILAHISQDKNLCEAFLNYEDIHTQTAAQVFEVSPEEVTSEMRSHAKAVNFGIVYGISDYGLSVQLGISRKQAKTYIDNYFARFEGVKRYMENVVYNAKINGYVTTMYNRRRELPDITHDNYNIRSAAERTAINTPIQGTAADIIKDAMVKVEKKLEKDGCLSKAKLLLQVHDELIFEVDKNILEQVALNIKDLMENIINLDVPLVVDLETGTDWYGLSSYIPGE